MERSWCYSARKHMGRLYVAERSVRLNSDSLYSNLRTPLSVAGNETGSLIQSVTQVSISGSPAASLVVVSS